MSLLKRLDWMIGPPACYLGAFFPKVSAAKAAKTLIIRPGGMEDLICADIALNGLGLDGKDFTWVIGGRAKAWARYRLLPHVCHDEKAREALSRVVSRYALVINTEQRYGLAEAYALACRAKRARLISFKSNRGSSWSNVKVSYDRKKQHETVEFSRLFAAALDLPEVPATPRTRSRMESADAPPLVLIAGRQDPERRLDVEAWTKLISDWHRHRPFLIAASPDDKEFASELAAHFPGSASLFSAQFNDLCRQIARSEELLTVEGPGVQIASYFGVPTVAAFNHSREAKWGSLAEGSKVVEL
jgi:ADP-heptose:LPS heptosyltransferase